MKGHIGSAGLEGPSTLISEHGPAEMFVGIVRLSAIVLFLALRRLTEIIVDEHLCIDTRQGKKTEVSTLVRSKRVE